MTQIEQTAEYIAKLSKKYKKPVFCSFIGGSKIFEGENVLNKNQIPVFRLSRTCNIRNFSNVAIPTKSELC
jgi:acyl-CoA synthetase (NDP forming)